MRVAIVGAGPAGASLAFLFARRGIDVVLVERQSDFAREFRGEGLMPSGVDALAQMGLAAELDALPQAQVSEISVWLGPRRVAAFGIDDAGGSRDVRADFTFGCDGRASLVRKRTGLERERSAPVFDVVWCKLPLPDGRLQLGWVIQKRHFGELSRAGIEHWIGELAANVPDDLSAWIRGASPAELDAAAARVAAERLPEVRAIQQLQAAPPRVILQTTPQSRLFMRWIFPALVHTGLFGALFARVFPRFALGTTEVRLTF